MRHHLAIPLLAAVFFGPVARPAAQGDPQVQGPLVSVPFENVRLTAPLWAERLEALRTTTLPLLFDLLHREGYLANFDRTRAGESGGHCGGPTADADVYRTLEAVAHVLVHGEAPELRARAEAVIERVIGAQAKDGYLHTHTSLARKGARWSDPRDGGELYCGGLLIEAGIAWFQATGERDLLEAGERFAALVDATFHEDGVREPSGHCGVELALTRLAALTDDDTWLWVAYDLLGRRGATDGRSLWGEEYQDLLPVREQFGTSGHALRALGQYRSMLEVYGAMGEYALMAPLIHAWRDITETRMYVTGGVGNAAGNEGFTEPYDLPNETAWCETAAAAEMVRWNRRMLHLTRQAAFADVEERVLFNALLAGASIEGDLFFHDQPQASRGGVARSAELDELGDLRSATEYARLLPTVGEGIYAQDEDDVFVCLFLASEAELELKYGTVRLIQETDYPWDGRVRIRIEPDKPQKFTLHVRVPAWCSGKIMAGPNDSPSEILLDRGDHPGIWYSWQRQWVAGDVLTFDMPMPVERVFADPRVAANAGRVALQRGPVVYALEGVDNGGPVGRISLPDSAELEVRRNLPELRGAPHLTGPALALEPGDGGAPRPVEHALLAVPYALWANRGPTSMAVWIPESPRDAVPAGAGVVAVQGGITVRASHCHRRDTPRAVVDGIVPDSSADTDVARLTFRGHAGTREWVELSFDAPRTVGGVGAYFVDEGRDGGVCATPRSWRVFWRDGAKWTPVRLAEGAFFFNTPDTLNEVRFEPVRTGALRMELQLRDGRSGGLHEWRVFDAD